MIEGKMDGCTFIEEIIVAVTHAHVRAIDLRTDEEQELELYFQSDGYEDRTETLTRVENYLKALGYSRTGVVDFTQAFMSMDAKDCFETHAEDGD